MKYEWRKQDKEIYIPKRKPTYIQVPNYWYYTLTGIGNPNEEVFQQKVGALYNASYGLKNMVKKENLEDNDYVVFPLEGIWSMVDEKKPFDKEQLQYTIMIRQPSFVTKEMAIKNIQFVQQNKPNPYLKDIQFEEINDGYCLQMLHLGSYDSEEESFSIMRQQLQKDGMNYQPSMHKEIYLSNPKRSKSEALKTVLRYFIQEEK